MIDTYLARSEVCVFHCKAGKGRTGTMLAAQLIYYEMSADEAILMTRGRNPQWIESDVQIAFLQAFEKGLRQIRGQVQYEAK